MICTQKGYRLKALSANIKNKCDENSLSEVKEELFSKLYITRPRKKSTENIFVVKEKQRVSGKNRHFSLDDFKQIVISYFYEDPEFQKLGIEKAFSILQNSNHILGLQCESVFDYEETKNPIDLNQIATQSEIDRRPFLAVIRHLPVSSTSDIIADLDVGENTNISAFTGKLTTIKEMTEGFTLRFNQANVSSAKSSYPLSVVADLTKFKTKSKMKKLVYDLNQSWNMFFTNPNLTVLQENSLVLSDMGAVSKAHFHPYMFTNLALCGTKCYVLFDVDEIEKPPVYNLRSTNIHTALDAKNKNMYPEVLNGKITRKLGFNEFVNLKRSFFAVISSSGDLPNFILVPSFYAHEVITVGTGNEETYGGLSGFALPNDYPEDKKPELNLLLHNALKKN